MIRIMNNKMVINIYQQLNQETNQANKKNRVQKKMNPKGLTPRPIIIKMPTVKDKERIL